MLGALARVQWSGLHVVVGIDGPDPALEGVTRDHGATSVTLASNRGSYAARNAAIDLLPDDIDIVAFTDSDCLPSPQWIAEHARALQDADMSGGGIAVTMRANPAPAEFVDRFRHLLQEQYVLGDGYAATANLAVRRSVLDTVRFDPRLRSGGDNDFGRRAREAGFTLVYSAAALVEHPARTNTAELRRKRERIITGIRSSSPLWTIRPVPFPPFKPKIVRSAVREGISRNPLWLLHAWLLQLQADLAVWRTVREVRSGLFRGIRDAPLRVGYLLDGFPKTSETFVTNEMAKLEQLGVGVVAVAIQQGPVKFASTPTHFFQWSCGWFFSILHAKRWFLTHPLRFIRSLRRLRRVRGETGVAANQFRRREIFEAASVLRSARVQLLHAHFAFGGAAAAYCLAALLDVPWTLTVHANDIFSDRRNLQLKLDTASRLITVCEYNRRYLQTELEVTRPIELVVCGVELPESGTTTGQGVDVIAVGRLVPKKGFDVLVEAAALLAPRRQGLRVEIIGEGPEQQRLADLIAARGLQGVVTLRGPMAHDQVLDRIGASGALVLPARVAANGDRDSMPVVLKEAMARGVPVVATNVGGIPEIVDTTVGALIEPEDADVLAHAIDRVLDLTPAKRAELSSAARARVADRLTVGGEVARLIEIFEDVIAAPRGG